MSEYSLNQLIDSFEPLYQYNSAAANINIDNSLAAVLDKFDEDYIIDAIRNSITYRFRPYDQPMPNVVYGYEQQFVMLSQGFSGNQDDISEKRKDTYEEIIKTICDENQLIFNQSDDTDYYSAAFYLYQFLISDFTANIINFFTNYLIKERASICSAMQLSEINKQDTALIYSKKLFQDENLGLIHGNIQYVLYNMQDFDIDLYSILELVYPSNPNIARYIYSIVSDAGSFFKNCYMRYALDQETGPLLQTAVKLQLQACGANIQDPDSIKEDQEDKTN